MANGVGRGTQPFGLLHSSPISAIRRHASAIDRTTARKSRAPQNLPSSQKSMGRLPPARYEAKSHSSDYHRSPLSADIIRSLIRVGTVTELYKAPSHLAYQLTGLCIGGTLISIALFWAHDMEDLATQADVANWLRLTFHITSVLLALSGTHAAFRIRGLIEKITAVPRGNSLLLQVNVRRVLPFAKPKILTTSPLDMNVKGYPNESTRFPIPLNDGENAYVKKGLWRWLAYSCKRYFTQDGFNQVGVRNAREKFQLYSLDAHGVFEGDGPTLYKIVGIRAIKTKTSARSTSKA